MYYKPGSKKAINCVKGRKALVEFSKKYHVRHEVCGKVVVATQSSELPFMDKIFENGMANNTEGIEKVTAEEIREIEPECNAIAGIRVPCTGIVDFVQATEKMVELALAKQEGSKVVLGETYQEQNPSQNKVYTNKNSYEAKHLIFCGGLQSDRLAAKSDISSEMKIVGFRGDYYELTEQAIHKVKHLIYPVPNPAFPFLGVHFTRMTNGEVECGPNAVFTFKREGYGKTDFDLKGHS